MTLDDDARDLAIYACIDDLMQKIMDTNNFTRAQAVERLEAFCEAERDEMRDRAQRAALDVHA